MKKTLICSTLALAFSSNVTAANQYIDWDTSAALVGTSAAAWYCNQESARHPYVMAATFVANAGYFFAKDMMGLELKGNSGKKAASEQNKGYYYASIALSEFDKQNFNTKNWHKTALAFSGIAAMGASYYFCNDSLVIVSKLALPAQLTYTVGSKCIKSGATNTYTAVKNVFEKVIGFIKSK